MFPPHPSALTIIHHLASRSNLEAAAFSEADRNFLTRICQTRPNSNQGHHTSPCSACIGRCATRRVNDSQTSQNNIVSVTNMARYPTSWKPCCPFSWRESQNLRRRTFIHRTHEAICEAHLPYARPKTVLEQYAWALW